MFKVLEGGRTTHKYLHTHDRICFKRCRRKWNLSSPFRLNLRSISNNNSVPPALWFGSGFHWAMEDYHGHQIFDNPKEALKVYYEAHQPEECPEGVEELLENGYDMLDYYMAWDANHAGWNTVWIDGEPLVEVDFAIELPLIHNGEPIAFGGTFDRIVEDEMGDWWVLDYKTVKAFDTTKLPLDQQISNYLWAAEKVFDHPIAGFIYLQIHKSPPKPPKILKDGSVSTASTQRTTFRLYAQALTAQFILNGTIPTEKQQKMLDQLEKQGSSQFINFQFVERNSDHRERTIEYMLAEAEDILNPDLPIYPNPTKDCSWDCDFRNVCIAYEEGADYEFQLEEGFKRREEALTEYRPWQIRMFKQYPHKFEDECNKLFNEEDF